MANILCLLLRRAGEEFRQYKLLYMLLILAAVSGLAFGLAASASMDDATADACRMYIGDYLNLLPAVDLNRGAEFLRTLLINGAILAVIMLAGLHMLGLPLIVAALFYKSFTIGFAVSFLAGYQSAQGVLVIIAAILPQNLLLLPLLLRAAREAVSLSLLMWRSGGPFSTDRRLVLTRYATFCVLALALTVLAALLQAYLTPLLLQLFHIIG